MKELQLHLISALPESTISTLTIPGVARAFFVCEDAIREPKARPDVTTQEWVAKWKVKGRTAIPSGRYRIGWTWSNRFQRKTLQLLDVPGFEGIRIHSGNTDEDTEGCLLPGMAWTHSGTVTQSRDAVKMIEGFLLSKGELREDTWITITRGALK